MTIDDLPTVRRWLSEPHVAPWYLAESTADAEVEKYRLRIEDPFSPTTMCMVELGGESVGWCQWYRYADYPAAGIAYGAKRGDIGADYALGEPAAVGHGVGTAMVAELVATVRQHYPRAALVIAPDNADWASRRVLEKNGFELVGVRPIFTDTHGRPMAIYRLHPFATPGDAEVNDG